MTADGHLQSKIRTAGKLIIAENPYYQQTNRDEAPAWIKIFLIRNIYINLGFGEILSRLGRSTPLRFQLGQECGGVGLPIRARSGDLSAIVDARMPSSENLKRTRRDVAYQDGLSNNVLLTLRYRTALGRCLSHRQMHQADTHASNRHPCITMNFTCRGPDPTR